MFYLSFYFNFREAGIEARKLSGFAKGYGYSPENPFTTNSSTDHAWNAVKINGKWYLIDSTWGAGHLNDNNEYEAVFTEFYFLPEPEMFILSHYPYENCSIEDSEKWQLLNRPVSLEEFNRSLMIYPTAHELGIYPTSHKENIVYFTDEVEFIFKEDAVRTNKLIATLYKRQGNMLYEEKFACHAYFSEGELKLKVKPSTTGTYRLQVFGNKRCIDGKASLLFEYILECTVPLNGKGRREYPYPETYSQTLEDECEILEPLGKPIMQNTPVTMRFRSTVLKRMMVNGLEMLRKENNIFESTFTAPGSDYAIQVFGARQDENPGSYHGVYTFRVL